MKQKTNHNKSRIPNKFIRFIEQHNIWKSSKTSKRIGVVFVSLSIIISSLCLFNSSVNAENVTSNPGENAYVSGIIVNTITDGSGSFDANNEPGNDNSNNNRIIRTYDTVRYAVEYTINMKPNSIVDYIENAYVNVEMSIDGQKGDVEFIVGDMPWLEDAKTSYTNGKITVTGKTFVKQNNGINPIPGTHGFNIVMQPIGVKNGTKLTPTFKAWLDGNESNEIASITCNDSTTTADGQKCTVTTSSSAKLDIIIVNDAYSSVRYADLSNNSVGYDKSFGHVGVMTNYGIIIMIHNPDVSKGRMGLENPSGDISFDITLSASMQTTGSFTPISYPSNIWNYRNCDNSKGGVIPNRKLNWYMGSASNNYTPSKGSGNKNVEAPGNYKIEEIGTNKLRVTVSDYEITSHFPTQNNATQGTAINYQDNQSVFSAGKLQTFTEVDDVITGPTNYKVTASISNVSYTSASGNTITTETRTTNNTAATSFSRRLKGSFSKAEYVTYATSAGILTYPTGIANLVRSTGQQIGFNSGFSSAVGNDISQTIYAANQLIKFDDKAYEPMGNAVKHMPSYDGNVKPKINVLFGAKKDGTGWASETELQLTRMKDMDFYTSLDKLKADGKTCVAVLLEERECVYMPGTGRDYNNTTTGFTIKSDCPPNEVYISTNDVYLWFNEAKNWTTDASFGNPDWNFVEPDVSLETGSGSYVMYSKSKYDEDGRYVSNHNSVEYGNCVYIVGETNSISKGFDMTTSTSSGETTQKTNYNLNFSERQVDFYIQPKVTSLDTSANKTTLKIVDILPKWLTYIPNSSVLGGIYKQPTPTEPSQIVGGRSLEPEISYDSSTGETTLTWILENVTPNATIDKIHYSCTIGDETNPFSDVDETDNPITTRTYMTSTYGARTNNITTSLSVIKSPSTNLSKKVLQKYLEKNDDISYTLTFSNTSKANTRPFYLFDVLPFNGDERGTDFSGTVLLSTVTINKNNAPLTSKQNIKMYYTTDTSIQNDTSFDAKLIKDMNITWNEVKAHEQNELLIYNINKNATAIKLTGDSLVSMESLVVDITMKNVNGESGNIYVNNASVYADRFADTVFSSKVSSQVVTRKMSGYIFNDNNLNDIKDDNDKVFSGVKVSLVDKNGNPAKDVSGNTIPDTTTDKNGYYEFNDFAPGIYQVILNNTNYSQINRRYKVMDVKSYKQESDNQYLSKDNDAILIGKDSNDSKYGYSIKEYQRYSAGSFIMDSISFDTADKMSSAVESFNDLNFGFIENTTNISLKKVNGKNPYQALNGAVFSIYRYNQSNLLDEGQTIPSDNIDINSGEWTKIGDITSENDGKMIAKNLSQGWYVIKETTAPKGYQISTGYYFVTIDFNDKLNSEISMKSVTDSEYEHQLDNGTYIIRNYPFQIFSFIKIDSYDYDIKLQNAKFGLYRLTCSLSHNHSNPESEQCWSLSNTVKSDKNGNVSFNNLSKGLYALVELQAPDDYSLPAGYWTIQISNTDEPIITCINEGFDKPLAFLKKDNNLLLPNQKIRTLPLSGSLLTPHHIYIVGGALTLVGIFIYEYQRNKIRIKHKRE